MDIIREFMTNTWLVYYEAAPFLLLGFVTAGILHQYMPDSFIQKHLKGKGILPIIKAAIIGTPVPLCSCGVVPVGLSLREKGLGRGPTSSFLVATPENGLDSISLSYSLFGGLFTGIRIFFSLVVAITTGILVKAFGDDPVDQEKAEVKGCCPSKVKKTSCCPSQKVKRPSGFDFVMKEFLPKTLHWLLLGFLLSGAISTVVPDGFLSQLSPGQGIFAAALIGVPLYVCASASTPIALSLFLAGMSPGACLVFLLTGPATNAANIPLYMKQLGVKTTLVFYASIFAVACLCGFVVDSFFKSGDFIVGSGVHQHGDSYGIVGILGTAAFTLFMLVAAYNRWGKPLATPVSTQAES